MFNSGNYQERKVADSYSQLHNSTNLSKKQRKTRKNRRTIASRMRAKNRNY